MRHHLADAVTIFDRREKENEREHLRTLWMLADYLPICFVSIDVEGAPGVITELGLVSQRKNEPRIGQHFVVQSTQATKSRAPLPLGFGMTSENVDTPQQLRHILDSFFNCCFNSNRRVILTGFALKGDLVKIENSCG